MKINTAYIDLEDLAKLYTNRERLAAANETLWQITGALRNHLAGSKDWGREIAGYEIKDRDELIEEIMNVLFVGVPAFRTMLNMEKERIDRMEDAEVKDRLKAQDNEDLREMFNDAAFHELDEKG